MFGKKIYGRKFKSCLHRIGLLLLLLLAVIDAGTAFAEYVSSDWALKPGLSLTGAAKYQEHHGASSSYRHFAATAELELYSPSRPYYGGLFADYRLSGNTGVDDQLNLGAYLRYDLPRWDFTGYFFNHRTVGSSGTAMYAGRARYRIRGGNKIGVEYMSTLRNSDYSDITVAYYGTLSDSLTFNVGIGRAIVDSPGLQARIEIAWQVR